MKSNNQLSRFGFSFERGGAHTSRTMMIEELRVLLSYVNHHEPDKNDYWVAVNDDNSHQHQGSVTIRKTAHYSGVSITLCNRFTY